MVDGDEESHIGKLYGYRLETLRTHAMSIVKFRCNEGVLAAMYICLGPLKDDFLEACRHIISLDGSFFRGLYGGQLLLAVGTDDNDSICPIAWVMVAKENNKN